MCMFWLYHVPWDFVFVNWTSYFWTWNYFVLPRMACLLERRGGIGWESKLQGRLNDGPGCNCCAARNNWPSSMILKQYTVYTANPHPGQLIKLPILSVVSILQVVWIGKKIYSLLKRSSLGYRYKKYATKKGSIEYDFPTVLLSKNTFQYL